MHRNRGVITNQKVVDATLGVGVQPALIPC